MSDAAQTHFDRENGLGPILGTLGGADITHIFVHSVTALGDRAELATYLPGFDKYAERALLLARPDDLVCVLEKVDEQYLQYLSQLGIGPHAGSVIVASADSQLPPELSLSAALGSNAAALFPAQKLAARGKRVVLHPYLVSPGKFTLAEILRALLQREVEVLGGNWPLINYMNAKHHVRTLALELGVPVPEGELVQLESPDGNLANLTAFSVAVGRHLPKTGKVVVKGARGSSGVAIAVIDEKAENAQKLLFAMMERMKNTTYLVEVMLEIVTSPNILVYIEPLTGEMSCVSVTDQILSRDLVHEGNIYPSQSKTLAAMLDSAWRIARWLRARGYCGFVGFDFGEYVHQETRRLEHFLAEVNPRMNAAAYPKFLMEYLNRGQAQRGDPLIEAFLSANITTIAKSFAEFVTLYGHLLFDAKAGKGLIPYNVGCLEKGRCSVVLFGKSRTEVIEMYDGWRAFSAGERMMPSDAAEKEQNLLR